MNARIRHPVSLARRESSPERHTGTIPKRPRTFWKICAGVSNRAPIGRGSADGLVDKEARQEEEAADIK
jgi:hypothetical protein